MSKLVFLYFCRLFSAFRYTLFVILYLDNECPLFIRRMSLNER